MAYIGIDQSYTGFAVVALNSSTLQPTDYLGKFPPTKYSAPVDRLLAIEDWLDGVLHGWDPDGVAMEGYANGAKFGREAAGELGYAVKRVLRKSSWECIPTIVPPTSLKKFVTGSGTAKKQEMLLGVYKRWGAEYKDDNLADAYSLARIAHAIDRPDLDRTKFQDEVLHKLSS